MPTYRIFSHHNVCEDSYENGEAETRATYDLSSIVNADSPLQALEKYYTLTLCKPFDPKNITVDDQAANVIHDTFLEDEHGMEVSESLSLYESWKKGDTEYLYSNNAIIYVSEMVAVDLTELFEAY
jgi:hypothetical protein